MTDQPESPITDELPTPIGDDAISPFGVQAAPPRRHVARALVITAIIIVIVAGGVAATTYFVLKGASSSGYRFTSKSFDYSVTLPAKPTVTEGTDSSGAPSERLQLNTGQHVVTMEANQLPVAVTTTSAEQSVLKAALKASSANLTSASPQQVKSFTWGGIPARSEVISTLALGTAYVVVAVKGKDFYFLIISHEDTAFDNSITRSFTVTR
jgi:hypothetical protein